MNDDKRITFVYYSALMLWSSNSATIGVLQEMLNTFLEKEDYVSCAGIQKAIDKLHDIHSEVYTSGAEEFGIEADDEDLVFFSGEQMDTLSFRILDDVNMEIIKTSNEIAQAAIK